MLYDKIAKDQLEARKLKDTKSVPLLSTLLGQVQKIAKDKGVPSIPDADVIAEVRKFLKSNNELQAHATGETLDLAKHEEALLNKYMPKQMSEAEIEAEVRKTVADGNAVLGKVMAHFKTNFAGTYDGAMVKEVATKVLAG